MLDRQCHFQEEMTSTYLYGMEGLNPFTRIPSMSLLPGAMLTDVNTHTMAYLLLSGHVEDADGTIKPSPVIKVNANKDGTHCFLHVRKKDAARLIRFTARVLQLMPSWLGWEIVICQNTSETDKVIWSGHVLESPATQRPPPQTATSVVAPQTLDRLSAQPTDTSRPRIGIPHTQTAPAAPPGPSDLITVHLTELQSAVASLTMLDREQALEIGELR